MDFTGSQMVLTLKIISAAVVYQDGLKPEKVSPLSNTRCITEYHQPPAHLLKDLVRSEAKSTCRT